MGENFVFDMPLWEIAGRATLLYFALTVIFRIMPKRLTGEVSPTDMITLVIIGAVAADAIMGESSSLPDLLVMIGVIVGWDYLFDLAEFYFPKFRRVSSHTPTLLIHDGLLLRDNLRKEKLTEEELSANLRKQGIVEMSSVKQAILEADGHISVVQKE